VERAVQTFKAGFKRLTSGSIETKIARFLLIYCTTPQGTTGSTPAELLMKYNLQIHLYHLIPGLSNRVIQAQEQQKTVYDRTAKDHHFAVVDHVMVCNYVEGPTWVHAHQSGPVS